MIVPFLSKEFTVNVPCMHEKEKDFIILGRIKIKPSINTRMIIFHEYAGLLFITSLLNNLTNYKTYAFRKLDKHNCGNDSHNCCLHDVSILGKNIVAIVTS